MRLEQDECRARLSAAPVARLATVGDDQWPHVVPITFAVVGERLVTAVDRKPKTTYALRRLRNIAANPRVCVLCDHYSDDWNQLWWVRADGYATVEESGPDCEAAIAALRAKYEQYRVEPPPGPMIVVVVRSWSGWAYSG
ncbi:PPOX class probable F420-dependent enzyme [Haloactinopolyspora alba]|uniref:PPOX class probable F420-dependent enzyme n=1 Tax=Haloactinopolyspora alba TaxID=648780 RepID=A0A2P8E7I9_9ACTN|nr:TIGR03668 family PPOX class F420-dependent oxidoreductase [Haloactinopolyspora alba]PSL05417.1 PPOX class probable F420-dependent enzyme [Haloactinopolyspora alba]